jgi:hypothetical protein
MRNRLDQLFKNKLSDHALAPSAYAWDRVKDGLAKKNNKPLLLRIAATVLLAGALTTTLFRLSSNDPVSNSSASLSKNEESKPNAVKRTNSSPPSTLAGKQKLAGQLVSKNKKKRPVEKNYEKVEVITEDQNSAAQFLITEEPQHSPPLSGSITTVTRQPMEEKPIVLVYRLETIEPLRVVESPQDPESKENSGLLRVIHFARDAKNGDGRLGDLRQAKDELFAFNFKKDKQNNHK